VGGWGWIDRLGLVCYFFFWCLCLGGGVLGFLSGQTFVFSCFFFGGVLVVVFFFFGWVGCTPGLQTPHSQWQGEHLLSPGQIRMTANTARRKKRGPSIAVQYQDYLGQREFFVVQRQNVLHPTPCPLGGVRSNLCSKLTVLTGGAWGCITKLCGELLWGGEGVMENGR